MKKLAIFFGAALAAVLTFAGPAAAQTPDKKITIQAQDITIEDAFAQIERQTGLSIAYGQSAIDVKRKIALSLTDATLDKAMAEVLESTNLTYKLNGYHIVLQKKPEPPRQPQPKKNVTVSGRVTDSATGEAIIGCMVFDMAHERGATTNAYGFYSLTLPAGPATLTASMPGYGAWERAQNLTRETTLDIALDAAATAIEQVVVSAGNLNPLSSHAGAVSVPVTRIRDMPALAGESDMMKALQYIPGVQSTSEGKADLSIRGGSPDQNLVLLDGNPIYNANHLFGFVSVFNTDALKNVTLYKSGFPARFGGRLSSVIDVNTKDGDKQRFGGSATLGLIAAKLSLEGPIVKDRTSFTLSGRRTWADAFMGALQEDDERTTIFFHDLNAKLHHRISDRTSVYIAAYHGLDRLKNTSDGGGAIPMLPGSDEYISQNGYLAGTHWGQQWRWGNTVVSARLNTALGGNLFLNANLSYNRYRYTTEISDSYTYVDGNNGRETFSTDIAYKSGIRDYTATVELEYIPAPAHYIRAGVQGIAHNFHPETLSVKDNGTNSNVTGGVIPAAEVSVYAEDEWRAARRLTLNAGVRASLFRVNGKSYGGVDPRLAAIVRLSDRVSLKAAYSRMQQYIHLLSNNSLFLQTDLWVPATGRVKPMNSSQWSAGASVSFPGLFDLSVEGYYKDMKNMIEYRDGASFSGSLSGWEDKVEAGKGRSYGVELSLERRVGSTTGAVSYALSKSERRFEGIDDGRWFPARYDRRHSVNITVTQRVSKKMDLTASWTYTTGQRLTVPMMGVTDYDRRVSAVGEDDWKTGWAETLLYEGRNNFRAPAYHRLDVGMNYHPRKWRNPQRYGEWNFSLYNAYCRMNTFGVRVDTGWLHNDFKPEIKNMILFPIIPSISYTYNF